MHHPTDKIAHTTAFVTPVVEHWLKREIAQGRKNGVVALPQCTFSMGPFRMRMHNLVVKTGPKLISIGFVSRYQLQTRNEILCQSITIIILYLRF